VLGCGLQLFGATARATRLLRLKQWSNIQVQSPPGTPKRHTRFAPRGAVTGIGSLPFASATSAVDAIVRLSPEIPFWPQLPTISLAESAICQGLAVVSEHIEPRNGGYGYKVKEGRIDSVLSILHRSSGELTKANASGLECSKKRCRLVSSTPLLL